MTPRRDEVYVMGAVSADHWEGDDTPIRGSHDDFMTAFADFHPDMRRAVEAAADVMIWPICDRWVSPSVVKRTSRWNDHGGEVP